MKADLKDERRSPKETQALMQVAMLSIIFVFTNLPNLGIALAIMLVPGYIFQGTYHNLYHLTVSLGFTGEMVNSSVNFFVYYHYNSKFRNACFSLLGMKKVSG